MGGNTEKSDVRETHPTREVFFDGIDDIRIVGGVFRCTLYSLQVIAPSLEPVKVAVLRIAIPSASVPDAASKAMFAVARHAYYGSTAQPEPQRAAEDELALH